MGRAPGRCFLLAIAVALLLPSLSLADRHARTQVKTFRYLAPARATALVQKNTRDPLPPPLIPLPPVRQHSEAACGLACLQSTFAYYGKYRRASQLVRAAQVVRPRDRHRDRYTYSDGTPESTMVALARAAGLKARASAHMRLDDLVRNVAAGRPVAVGIQAWASHPEKVDWRKENGSGHYVVAIGIGDAKGNAIASTHGLLKRDDAYVWFMDPAADLGNRGYIPVKEFMARWHWPADHGDATHRFGMVLSSPKRPSHISFVDGVERIK
jgi:hypothetical protein